MMLDTEKEYLEALRARPYIAGDGNLEGSDMLQRLIGKQYQAMNDLYRVQTMSTKRIEALLTREILELDEMIEYAQEEAQKTGPPL